MKDQIKGWCVCNRTYSVIFVCFCFVFLIFFSKKCLFSKRTKDSLRWAMQLFTPYSFSVCLALKACLKQKKHKRTKPILGKWFMTTQIEEKERPLSNLYSVCVNLFTPKISSVILLIICHAILMILVWRILGIGSTKNPLIAIFLYSHHFSAKYWIENVRRNSLLVTHGSESVKQRKSCTWKWSNDKFQ